MKTARTITREQNRVQGRVDEQIMRVGFGVLTLSSCVIGLWALASLVGGMVASGGPLALAANWLRAVTG
jgi:hypothetical protein